MTISKPFRTTRTIANLRAGRNEWYRISAQADGFTPVHIYDEIGYFGVTAGDFAADLAGIKGDIELHLNTPGGDVFEGITIYEQLSQRDGIVRVLVDGLAASAGSVIAMAADPGNLIIAPNASMMIHEGFSMGVGDARDMRKLADLLDEQSANIANIYAARTGQDAGQVGGEVLGGDAEVAHLVENVDERRAVRLRLDPVPVITALPQVRDGPGGTERLVVH